MWYLSHLFLFSVFHISRKERSFKLPITPIFCVSKTQQMETSPLMLTKGLCKKSEHTP